MLRMPSSVELPARPWRSLDDDRLMPREGALQCVVPIDSETRRRQILIGAFAAAMFFIHFATDGRYGYFRDELYFLDAAHHLDWGYVDFAPLTAWMLRANEFLFGDSLHALRLLPAIAAAIK